MAEQVVNVGLVGLGTVGTGVAKLILEHGDLVAAKTGVHCTSPASWMWTFARPGPLRSRRGF